MRGTVNYRTITSMVFKGQTMMLLIRVLTGVRRIMFVEKISKPIDITMFCAVMLIMGKQSR